MTDDARLALSIKALDTAEARLCRMAHIYDRAFMGRGPTASEESDFADRNRQAQAALDALCACRTDTTAEIFKKIDRLDEWLAQGNTLSTAQMKAFFRATRSTPKAGRKVDAQGAGVDGR